MTDSMVTGEKCCASTPGGSAPLTAILSMLQQEALGDTEFHWYEKRYVSPRFKTRGTNPLTSTEPTTGDADDGTVSAGAQATSADIYIKVDTIAKLRPGQLIIQSGKRVQLWIAKVTKGVAKDEEKGFIMCRPSRAFAYATTDWKADTVLRVIGSAYGEGAGGRGIEPTGHERPITIRNITSIDRTPMKFSGTVLKIGLKYDRTGPYRDKAKDTVVDHMTGLERKLLFGIRSSTQIASLDTDQEKLDLRTGSGILEFLELWDKGSVGLQVDGETYAPYSFKGESTDDSDDEKRIIENADGVISVRSFNAYTERIQRYHSTKSPEKLVLVGSGAALAIMELVRNNTTFMIDSNADIYGISVTTIKTPVNKFHILTHPLFSEDEAFRYWMLFLDLHSIRWRALRDRDTELLKGRQNNGDDFRKDEYLTEWGLEFWYPERSMLIKNVKEYQEDA